MAKEITYEIHRSTVPGAGTNRGGSLFEAEESEEGEEEMRTLVKHTIITKPYVFTAKPYAFYRFDIG